jgi:hypothetical protein
MDIVAPLSIDIIDIRCMGAIDMARIGNKKPKKIFWLHLYHYVFMEHSDNMVDMERIITRSHRGFFGQ